MIFVTVRYTQIDAVLPMLKENISENLVFVGNNVRAVQLSERLPGKNVQFAFLSVGGHRGKDRVVSIRLNKMTAGPLTCNPEAERLLEEIFKDAGLKVKYEDNMGDYLLCHAAFVLPCAFACYIADGNLHRIQNDTDLFNQVIQANREGYRAIQNAGHEILPEEDQNFEGEKYRKTCFRFLKLLCHTFLGRICLSDHAMHSREEIEVLNRDMHRFFDDNHAQVLTWKELERKAGMKDAL